MQVKVCLMNAYLCLIKERVLQYHHDEMFVLLATLTYICIRIYRDFARNNRAHIFLWKQSAWFIALEEK